VYNFLYRAGFKLVLFLLIFVAILFAPFHGLFVGLLEFLCQLARSFARPIGRVIADLTGSSAFWGQINQQMHEIKEIVFKRHSHVNELDV